MFIFYVRFSRTCALSQALYQSRSKNAVINNDAVSRIGNNLSSRIPLKQNNGNKVTKGFFTAHSVYDQEKEWKQIVDKNIKAFPSKYRNNVNKILTDAETRKNFCKYIDEPSVYNEDYENGYKNILAATAVNLGMASDITEARDLLDENEALREAMKNICVDSFKPSVTLKAMSAGGIEAGSRIDQRNCAMYDMAKLLGCSDIIASATPMTLTVNGQEMQGVFMENAEGSNLTAGNITAQESFSDPKVLKQLSDMQVLDFLCGNVDRHTGNLIYQYGQNGEGKTIVTGIKAIDNDMSFGNPAFDDNIKRYAGHLVHPERMKVIDFETARKVQDMDKNVLKTMFAHYGFTDKEIDAAEQRLKKLQDTLDKRPPVIKVVRGDDWEKQDFNSFVQKDADECTNLFGKLNNDYKELQNKAVNKNENNISFTEAENSINTRGARINKMVDALKKADSFWIPSKEFKTMRASVIEMQKLNEEYMKNPDNQELKDNLEKAFTDLRENSKKYILAKAIEPKTGHGASRKKLASELMDFAEDMVQEFEVEKGEMENEMSK